MSSQASAVTALRRPAAVQPLPEPEPDSGEFAFEPAGPALSGYVLGYRGFRIGSTRPRTRLVVPDGSVRVLFGFEAPVRMVDTVRPQRSLTAVSIVGPVALSAVVGRHAGRVHGVVAVLTPLGAYRLFGMPMTEWSELDLDPEELIGHRLPALRERLAQCATWPDRFRLLDRLFTEQIHAGPECHGEVTWAWRTLQQSGGRVPIQELASGTGWSRRHLERRFREQVGRSPKEIAQVRRIQVALRMREAGVPLAHIATRAGFHDQPHFTRAFKAMLGCTPSRLPAARVDWTPDTLLGILPEPAVSQLAG
jgi:AraC-like DNA-binding protein